MEVPASSLSKEKSQQAETELQAALRELGSERVAAVKALVDPRLLKLFEASPTEVLVHAVPHKCCVPLTGKAKGILCGIATAAPNTSVAEADGIRRLVCSNHGKGKAPELLLEDGWYLLGVDACDRNKTASDFSKVSMTSA